MAGLHHHQVWVTSVLCDGDVAKALHLRFSLSRVYTSRKIAVLASPKVSSRFLQLLRHEFDYVFALDEKLNTAALLLEDFARFSVLGSFQGFENAVYLSPTLMAVKNPDDIFSVKTDSVAFLSSATDYSVFCCKPNVKCFEVLMAVLKDSAKLGIHPMNFLKEWAKNQSSQTSTLDEKYSRKVTLGDAVIENQYNTSFVNLKDFSSEQDIKQLETHGLFEKLIAIHWLKIQHENVIPLTSEHALAPATDVSTPMLLKYSKEPIAIVGMSCRFPGSNNLDEFWNLLSQGEEGICTPPEFRWQQDQSFNRRADARKTNAGFLKVPVDEFDGKFFGISPKEVNFLDPQHRLLLELVWEGLEDACIDPHSLYGTSGSVFTGSWTNDYRDILTYSGNYDFYRMYMGNSVGAAAARISFLLGLTGPSIATESGCSSAMVAVQMAMRSLQLGETNVALACGVNLLLHPFDKDILPMVVSPDGHCKTFSEDANGFARAEGGGVLVLKRLSDALKNGDHIWGILRGSAMTQEGLSKSMGTPTVHSESLSMSEALKDAGLSPEQISYVETHGTGTAVGDPLEVAAIEKAYHTPNRKQPLIIGSVKTNVGHTESCSGITGIMKVVLSMKNELIPAHRNFTKLNPLINLDAVPAQIPLEPVAWPKLPGKSRYAGVSAFGITGTDVHVIVEEPPQEIHQEILAVPTETMERTLQILKISAKSEEALAQLLQKFQTVLETSSESLANICHSANAGRANFPLRAAILGKSKPEMVAQIQQEKFLKAEVNLDSIGKICFLFTGQGSQYPGMAKELYFTSPVFKVHFDLCANILQSQYKINVKQVLWPSNGFTDKYSSSEVSRTIYSQTSIFCVEYALLRLWQSWGFKPDYVLGHSLGEFAAAVCANILKVEDAIKLVAQRSLLIDQLPGGKMLVIKANKAEVDKAMKPFSEGDSSKYLDYAALNSSQQTVVAGDSELVLNFAKFLEHQKIKCVVLEATHAFHSRHMDPILNEYRKIAKFVEKPGDKICEYISGLKGDLIDGKSMNAQYWVDHTREKVCFSGAIQKAVELGCKTFIEIGPQPVLSALTMANSNANLLCLPSLRKTESEWTTLLNSLAKLYLKGVAVDWAGFDRFYQRSKVRLPHYPFIGKKAWPEITHLTGNSIHPLLGAPISNASSLKLFQCGVNLTTHEWIKDHAIGQTAVFPGAGYLEMCLAAGLASVQDTSSGILQKPNRAMKIENLHILAPMALEETKLKQLQTLTEFNKSANDANDWENLSVKIYHQDRQPSDAVTDTKWICHATATFSPLLSADDKPTQFDKQAFLNTINNSEGDTNLLGQIYEKVASVGLKFGPEFQTMETLWKLEDRNSWIVKIKNGLESNAGSYIFHPTTIDAMLQVMMLDRLESNKRKKLYVPIKIGKFLWLSNSLSEQGENANLYVQVTKTSGNGENLANIYTSLLINSNGTVLAEMSQVELIDTTVRGLEAVLEQQTCAMPSMYEETWRGQAGPMQHSHDVETCNREVFYSQEFYQMAQDKYDKLSPKLETFMQNFDKYLYYQILRGLYLLGWKPEVGSRFTRKELVKRFKVEPRLEKQFGYFLQVLEEEQVIKKEVENWQIISGTASLEEVEEHLAIWREPLLETFKCTGLMAEIGKHLPKLLRGEMSALPIIFPEDGPRKEWPSARDFYVEYGEVFNIVPLAELVMTQSATHCRNQHADLTRKFTFRVCEIGAGTGMLSGKMLDTLSQANLDFEYTYTDISAAFFVPAEKKFEKYLKHLIFKKLNIEEDPITQGFVPGYYDLVFASDVIHATRNLRETFANVKTLLKSGGRFSMVEQTKINRMITYSFGFLDGFWRFEDFDVRPDHCTLSTERWTEVLIGVGLSVQGVLPCANQTHSFLTCVKKNGGEIKTENKIWILFDEENSKTCKFLKEKMPQLANRKMVKVKRGKRFSDMKMSFEIRPDNLEDFACLLGGVVQNYENCTLEGIIYGWSLGTEAEPVEENLILKPFFNLAKSVIALKRKNGLKLIVLTSGLAPVEDSELTQWFNSTILGFCKSLRNEHQEFHTRVVDIGQNESEAGLMQIFYEVWNPNGKDTQVAYRGLTRYTPKIMAVKPALQPLALPQGVDRFQLVLPETRTIEDLQFAPLEPFALEEEEIEVHVKATSLNFKDVLCVLKPIEGLQHTNTVGLDFAGIVKRVGGKVTKWQVGDAVFGINLEERALPSHLRKHEDDVSRVPNYLTFAETSTLPAVMCTVLYCLSKVANVKKEDTVLLHTASGGVGLYAIQFCQSIGATVIATAGSARKKNYLRSLGIEHVFHSRNTSYEQDILRVTNGRGVDVVLNSLTSEGFKEATLRCCAKNARFVEMSKLSIWSKEEVRKLRPDVEYTTMYLGDVSKEEWTELRMQLGQTLEDKKVVPIPYVSFDGVHVREALQFLQKAKHIGKVVCVMPEVRLSQGEMQVYAQMFNKNATYLVTGGLGGIGFEVCKWMVTKGARFVVLVGRTPPDGQKIKEMDNLNKDNDSQVRFVQMDVSDFQECEDLVKIKIPEMGYPVLRGVMHAAGTLHDGLIENHDWTTFSSTFKPKVKGTWNLHQLTKDNSQLEHFVMFSSMASVFGSPGQSNHSAGNNFEDLLAHYRHSLGLPATSVNWGQWGEVGVATEVDIPGIRPFSTLQGITGLEYVLKSQRLQTAIINIDSFVLLNKLFPLVAATLDERIWKSGPGSGGGAMMNLKSDEFWQQYDSAECAEQKMELLKNVLSAILRHILKHDETDVIDDTTTFQDMGVDSLMLVEIKNALQNLFGDRVTVNASALRDCNTIQLLSEALFKNIEGQDDQPEEVPSAEEVQKLLKEDAQLKEEIRARPEQTRVNVKEISRVLLTGVTGTLGPYLLRELSNHPQIREIICLIRPRKNVTVEERLERILKEREIVSEVRMEKVKCVEGNVALERLGLEDKVWEELSNEVDAVVHSAAKVTHVEQYKARSGEQDSRRVNIEGTKHVLEFAVTGNKLKHVCYTSGLIALATTGEDGNLSESWPEVHDYNEVTTMTYPITKFVGDLLMKEAVTQRGIPGKSFRLPVILGDSKTGRFIMEQNHVMLRYMFILKTGKMPSNPVAMPMLPVDTCAWATVNLFLNPEAPNEIYNVCNLKPDMDQEFTKIAQRLGYKVDVVEFSEFAKSLAEVTMENSPFAIFKELYVNRDDDEVMKSYSTVPALRQWLLDGATRDDFSRSKKLTKYLPEFYTDENSTMEHVFRDLTFAKGMGWLEKFT